ncbi:hypothetical protein HanIR_Chr15g0767561 [Helianthus annuus]|nr:hypothetical protein HanIR_Chr15g0767561 [Helianthus annuus]
MNVKLKSLFDPFRFEIVERNLSKFLFAVSYRPLVMTQNPSLFDFPYAFLFLSLRIRLIPHPSTGCFTEIVIIAPLPVCIKTSFRFTWSS